MREPIRNIIKIISAATLLIFITGCGRLSQIPQSTRNGLFFDTLVSITIYSEDSSLAEKLLDDSMNMCEQFEKLFSASVTDSEISKINTSAGVPVTVSEDTFGLLSESLYYCELSGGKFDITIAPLTKLWDFHKDKNVIPESESIESCLKHVDYHLLRLNPEEKEVYLSDDLAQIEIGGIAKGYIADRIGEYLSGQNITGALINMGGDIKTVGFNQYMEPFSIGINNPHNTGVPLFPIYISNMSVATSGTYERCFTGSDGRLYHHILDPATGFPAESDLIQATVITNDSVDADALATVCILLGADKAFEFVENIDNTEAILITESGDVLKTSGTAKYLNRSQ